MNCYNCRRAMFAKGGSATQFECRMCGDNSTLLSNKTVTQVETKGWH